MSGRIYTEMGRRFYMSTTDGEPFIVGLRDAAQWRLVVVAGGRRISHPLPSSPVAVGRSIAAEIQVIHPSVSRMQCVIELRGRRVFVSDCGDEVGVLVEGEQVPPWAEVEAHSGAAITLSGAVYVRLVECCHGNA